MLLHLLLKFAFLSSVCLALKKPEIHGWLEQNSYICVLDPIRNSLHFLTTEEAHASGCSCGDPLVTESACAQRNREQPHCRRLPDLCLREYQILFSDVVDRNPRPAHANRPTTTTTTPFPTPFRRRTPPTFRTNTRALNTLAPAPHSSSTRIGSRRPPPQSGSHLPLATTTTTRRGSFTPLSRNGQTTRRFTTPTTTRRTLANSRTVLGRRFTANPLNRNSHRSEQLHSSPSSTSRRTTRALDTTKHIVNRLLTSTEPSIIAHRRTAAAASVDSTSTIKLASVTIPTTAAPSTPSVAIVQEVKRAGRIEPIASAAVETKMTINSAPNQVSTKLQKLERVRSLIKDLLHTMSNPDERLNDLEKLFDDQFRTRRIESDVPQFVDVSKKKVEKETNIVRSSAEEGPEEETRIQRVVLDEQMNLLSGESFSSTALPPKEEETTKKAPASIITTTTVAVPRTTTTTPTPVTESEPTESTEPNEESEVDSNSTESSAEPEIETEGESENESETDSEPLASTEEDTTNEPVKKNNKGDNPEKNKPLQNVESHPEHSKKVEAHAEKSKKQHVEKFKRVQNHLDKPKKDESHGEKPNNEEVHVEKPKIEEPRAEKSKSKKSEPEHPKQPKKAEVRSERVQQSKNVEAQGEKPKIGLKSKLHSEPHAGKNKSSDPTKSKVPIESHSEPGQPFINVELHNKPQKNVEPLIERLRQRIEILEARLMHTIQTKSESPNSSAVAQTFRRQMIDLVRRQRNHNVITKPKEEEEEQLTDDDISSLRSTADALEKKEVSHNVANEEEEKPLLDDIQSSNSQDEIEDVPQIQFTTSKFDAKLCEDNHPLCEYWAFYKQCGNNAQYMYKYCRKACGICDFRL